MKYFKFIVLSLIGIFLFFVPVQGDTVLITLITNQIKQLIQGGLRYLPLLSVSLLFLTVILAKIFHYEKAEAYLKNIGKVRITFFICSFLAVLMIMTKTAPAFMLKPEIGDKVIQLSANVFMTITVAGWAVVFILKSGIVEFVAELVEPIMRPIFKIPGEAAVNIISSFVSSASVGVYFTEQYYLKGTYTLKEAMDIVMNYSVISVGYMGVLVSITGIEDLYGKIILTSFVLILIMGAIMVRIPPFTRFANTYVDGRVQTKQDTQVAKLSFTKRFEKAISMGVDRAKDFQMKDLYTSLKNALKFAQMITGVMITSVLIVLIITDYTPLFDWLGLIFVPYLKLVGIPEAIATSPSVVLEFVEVSLPSISAQLHALPRICMAFVVILSILQVIFMTEAGNAMLSSELPVNFKDLVVVFFIRTILAIPLASLAAHLLVAV